MSSRAKSSGMQAGKTAEMFQVEIQLWVHFKCVGIHVLLPRTVCSMHIHLSLVFSQISRFLIQISKGR